MRYEEVGDTEGGEGMAPEARQRSRVAEAGRGVLNHHVRQPSASGSPSSAPAPSRDAALISSSQKSSSRTRKTKESMVQGTRGSARVTFSFYVFCEVRRW